MLHFLLTMLVLLVYLSPSLAAFASRKKHAQWIALVNLIPIVGWIAAVIWYSKDSALPLEANISRGTTHGLAYRLGQRLASRKSGPR